MKEDNKDYSSHLDSKINDQKLMPQEASDENDIIYNPPDINLINNKERNVGYIDKKDEIKLETNDSEKKKGTFDFLKDFNKLINDVDFILDDLIHIGPDKEKYKKLFAELRKRREDEDKITDEEYLLFDIMHKQFSEPKKFNFDKIFNKEIDEKTDLSNILNENKNGLDIYKVYANLKKINKEITMGKEEEKPIIVNNKSNISNKNKKERYNFFLCCFYSLGYLQFFCNDFIEDHCGCCVTDKFKDLNLHTSFIFYIIQYLVYIIVFIFDKEKYSETSKILSIIGVVIGSLFGSYFFYKLNYNKFNEEYIKDSNTFFMVLSMLKMAIYYLFYLLIKSELRNKNAKEIFYVCFCFKIVILIFCFFHFKKASEKINYFRIFMFEIFCALISSLILLLIYSKTEFIIGLIICSIQIILLNLGIIFSLCQELLMPIIIWNTVCIEVYKLSIFIVPVFGLTYFILWIYTCGFICCRT